jgi:hypothetical protein
MIKDLKMSEAEFDVDECINDLICNGEADRGDNQPKLYIDEVHNDLSENITTQELIEIFELARLHQGSEVTAIIRRYLKRTARPIIESDMPKPLGRAA